MEIEFLAKKFDRFGWDRERNTPAQDRQKLDFMDALQDFPLSEVQAACKAAVLANPNRMPNEGHIVAEVLNARKRAVVFKPRQVDTPRPEITPEDLERRAALAAELLGNVKRMGEAQ
jgi:hypothetical protein